MDAKLAGYVARFPWLFSMAILWAFIGAILLILQLKLVSFLFNNLIFIHNHNFPFEKILILIALLIALRTVFLFLEDITSSRLAIRIKSSLREMISQHVLETENLQDKSAGDLQSIYLDDVEALDSYFSLYLPQVIYSVIIPVTLLFFVFPLDWLSGIVFLVTIPLIPIFMILIGKYAGENNNRQLQKLHQMSAFFLDSIQGIQTLVLFNQTQKHIKRVRQVSEDYRRITLDVLKISFLSAFSLELLSTISIAVIAVEIGLRLLYNRIGFEQAFLLLLISPEIYQPLRNLGLRFHAAMSGLAAAKNIFAFVDTNKNIKPNGTQKITTQIIQSASTISLESVDAGYQGQYSVLKNIHLAFKTGTVVAIIGGNGSGKSTLFQLLLGFIPPKNGRIFIGDQNITQFTRESWRENISWLSQEPLLNNKTIRENLLLSSPNASINDIYSALESVGLLKLINNFPKGIDTELTEFGLKLSRGESQKIALARIFLRKTPIILLDEPTASLDVDTESDVLQKLRQVATTSTFFIIAHNLHTIRLADQIILLKNGKVVANGVHKDLLKNNDDYAAYYNAYSENFS